MKTCFRSFTTQHLNFLEIINGRPILLYNISIPKAVRTIMRKAVRKATVSRHHGDEISTPWNPSYITTLLYWGAQHGYQSCRQYTARPESLEKSMKKKDVEPVAPKLYGNNCQYFITSYTSGWMQTEKSFRNFIKSTRNQILFIMHWLIWNQMDVLLVLSHSENSIYNLISSWFNMISKRFLYV